MADSVYTEVDPRFDPISMYLMAAYAYYKDDDPILADFQFDDLANYLLENIDDLPEHPHKHMLTKDMLRAGTYLGDYPGIVRGALDVYKREVLGKK